jgi:hypothetical protein
MTNDDWSVFCLGRDKKGVCQAVVGASDFCAERSRLLGLDGAGGLWRSEHEARVIV